MSEQLLQTAERQEVRDVDGEDTRSLEWHRTKIGAAIAQLRRHLAHYADVMNTMEHNLDTADAATVRQISEDVVALRAIIKRYSLYR